jgi:spermidine synthase
MEKLFEELDFRQTPLGDLILQRRRYLQLDGLDVFEVKLGDAYLMSSLFHVVEVALANLGLDALGKTTGADIVCGGLGLGYTAAAALKHPSLKSLIVVDALDAVIDWHRRGLVPLGHTLTKDPRCRFVHADFFNLASNPQHGFDPTSQGRKFHAILLDIDHSPRNLLAEQNAPFYQPKGLANLAAHLHPGGVFSLWSDDPPDETFLENLRSAFSHAKAHVVPFSNPLLGKPSASTVYVSVRD